MILLPKRQRLYQHRPQITKTNFCVINVTKKCPPNHSTLQWHPAMAPSNVHRPLPQSWSSPSPSAVANYNGTLRWHSNVTTSSAPCSGTLVPRPIRQSGSSPSPPMGNKNPYSYRYLGKKQTLKNLLMQNPTPRLIVHSP